jgi:hypothetical protein
MDKRILLIFIIFGALFFVSAFKTYAVFSGGHAIYENKTTAPEFCIKCHPDKVSFVNKSIHRNAGCICHGYNPNASSLYNINLAHNLTKQIYCTNCHTNYSIDTGDIIIHQDENMIISGINQSAHYIIPKGNKAQVYDRARQFFNGS